MGNRTKLRRASPVKRPDMLGNEYAKGNSPNQTSWKPGQTPWNKQTYIETYCACGCGEICTLGPKSTQRKYIHGHNRRGTSWTDSQRKSLTASNQEHGFQKGHIVSPNRVVPKGSNHYRWKGGKSNRKKTPKKLRESILRRDSNRCTVCRTRDKLNVHHMDGNKENNIKKNLITLCHSCHSRYHAMEAVA